MSLLSWGVLTGNQGIILDTSLSSLPEPGSHQASQFCFLNFTQISQLPSTSSPPSRGLGLLRPFLIVFYASTLSCCQSILHEEWSFKITNLIMSFLGLTPFSASLAPFGWKSNWSSHPPKPPWVSVGRFSRLQSSCRSQTCPASPASLLLLFLCLDASLLSLSLTHLSALRLHFLKPSLSPRLDRVRC